LFLRPADVKTRSAKGNSYPRQALRHRLLGGGDRLDIVGLEARQDIAGEALDLRHEQIVR
jgi:hypothetical protein